MKKINISHDNVNSQKKAICFTKIDNVVFDLNLLPLDKFTLKADNGEKIRLSLCRNLDIECQDDRALLFSEKECKKLSGHRTKEKTIFLTKDSMNNSVLKVYLPEGDICKQDNNHTITRYNTTFEITCRLDTELSLNKEQIFYTKKCENTIKMSSRYACTYEKFLPWWDQIGLDKKVISIFLFLLGIYFIFFGYFLKKVNLIIINVFMSMLVIYTAVNIFFHLNMLMCLFLSGILSFICHYFESLNTMVLGINLGFSLANVLYFFEGTAFNINLETLYWCNIVFFGILVPVIGGFMKEIIYDIMCSLFGTYLFERGVYILGKGNTDEQYIIKLIFKKEFNQLYRIYRDEISAYFIGILLTTFLGVVFRHYLKKNEIKKRNEEFNLIDK